MSKRGRSRTKRAFALFYNATAAEMLAPAPSRPCGSPTVSVSGNRRRGWRDGQLCPARRTGRPATTRCLVRLTLPTSGHKLNYMVQCQEVDMTFVAVADATRRAVLERLARQSATVSELAEPFGLSLTGMQKHVRVLEAVGSLKAR